MLRKLDIKNKLFISKHFIGESLMKYQEKFINHIYCCRKLITFYTCIDFQFFFHTVSKTAKQKFESNKCVFFPCRVKHIELLHQNN